MGSRPSRLEEQTGFVLRKAHQRASEIFNQVMGSFEVTPTQFSTLIRLDDIGEASQNQLGRMVAMDPATTRGVVKRLHERGLLTLRPDPAHRRRQLVGLTPEGSALARRMRIQAHEVTRRILTPLKARERETLMRLLTRLE